ncbi:MAG: alpha/beta hydrolase [Lachnospiraceae bacterium]|nr:alpha/beta hydrolase [Lachnospiraceae bacterium]
MRRKKVSVRGVLMRDLIHDVMETSLGGPIQSGEFRKNPVEPAWICPAGYEYEIIEQEHFKMEYLRPAQVVTGRVILQLHGGGYIGPMKNIYRKFAVRYSKRSLGGDVLTIDYRVAPEHPFPAALEDAAEAYHWLLEEKHYQPSQIVVAGDSAGGGLALALVMYLRDKREPLPAGLILMSPWADLTCSGESYETNYENDPLFGKTRESMLYHSSYIGEEDPENPYISPVFGDYHGLPPMLFQVGSCEMLLSDSLRAAGKAREAGVRLRLSEYEGMFHVFQMSLDLFPESRDAWDEVEMFLKRIYQIEQKTEGRVVKRIKNPGKRKKCSLGERILSRIRMNLS